MKNVHENTFLQQNKMFPLCFPRGLPSMGTTVSFPGVKWQRHEQNQSPPCDNQVKNVGSNTLIPHMPS